MLDHLEARQAGNRLGGDLLRNKTVPDLASGGAGWGGRFSGVPARAAHGGTDWRGRVGAGAGRWLKMPAPAPTAMLENLLESFGADDHPRAADAPVWLLLGSRAAETFRPSIRELLKCAFGPHCCAVRSRGWMVCDADLVSAASGVMRGPHDGLSWHRPEGRRAPSRESQPHRAAAGDAVRRGTSSAMVIEGGEMGRPQMVICVHHRPARRSLATELWLAFAADLPRAVQGGAAGALRRRSCGRTVARAEKYGPRGVDGPVVPRPDLLDRPHGAYIVWQNFVNSYQIYKKDREMVKNRI